MKRVERMNARIKVYNDDGEINGNMVTSWCMDIVKEYKDERKWDFMREGKVIIYYNNVNLYGTVDNVFEEIVMRYAVDGSIIMCYRRVSSDIQTQCNWFLRTR